MKILLATGIYPPDIGGPATYVKILEEELPKYGFIVKVLTYSDEAEINEEGVTKISRKQNIFFRYWRYFVEALRLCGWADVIYSQDPMSAGLPVYCASLLKRKEFILKIVGDYAWEQGRQKYGVEARIDDFQERKYDLRVELLRFIQRLVAGKAKFIITPSQYLKGIIKKWGVREENIKVIYNAVKKAEPLPNSREELRRKLNLSGNIILSAGRLVPWKGFSTLIEIMPALLKENPKFRLIIVGEGSEAGNLKNKVKDLGLEKNVTLTGSLPQATLWEYMRATDMFVLNTGYEGLPHITIEAMQLGTPVITTRSGGNPEVIRDGETGMLVNYDNREEIKKAIIKLWKDKELADGLATRGCGDIKDRFGRGRMVNEVNKIL